MSTRRSTTKIVEREGVRYTQQIVENTNCIFQEILHGNDQGNDCFVEFISEKVATSFCVFGQIKSGKSYRDRKGYKIPANKDHLEYWHNHLLPVAGIVYDEELKKAFWVNISSYIKSNLHILDKKTHVIRVPHENEFSSEKFDFFKNHFAEYITQYKSLENFGRSLSQFAKIEDANLCYEGLKSLFSNHRDKEAAWHYIILNFGIVNEPAIQRNILGMISNYADNPHIFWHKDNLEYYPSQDMHNHIRQLVNKSFTEREVKIAISFMDNMVVRGDFSYLVFLVLDFIEDIDKILYHISNIPALTTEERNFSFWLYVHFAHAKSVDNTIQQIDHYLKCYPNNDEDDLFIGMRETMRENGFIPIG